MCFDMQGRVLALSKTKQSQRLLLLALAYHADSSGVCWPSIETLAREINAAPRNAASLVAKLKQTGEIIVFAGGGRRNSNTYLITLGQSQETIDRIIKTHPRLSGIKPDDNDMVYTTKNPDDIILNTVDIVSVYATKNPDDSGINPDDIIQNPDDSGINPDDIIRRTKRTKNRTERELQHVAVAADFSSPDLDPELTAAMNVYKNNIGPMTPVLSSDFQDIYHELKPPPGESRKEWIEYAVLTAAANGKAKWAYVKAIIKGISNNGSLQKHKEQWNGQQRGTGTGEQQFNGKATRNGYHSPQYDPAYFTANGDIAPGWTADEDAALRRLFERQ